MKSAGPDGRFNTDAAPSYDDFTLATVGADSFANTRIEIERALIRNFDLMHEFPENMDQFRKALQMAGIDWDALRDAWGQPLSVIFSHEYRYTDNMLIESYSDYAQQAGQRTRTMPVSQKVVFVIIQSPGKEGDARSSEPIAIATYSRALTEQSSKNVAPVPVPGQIILAGRSGEGGDLRGRGGS